jgi:hypothetical protein
MKLLVICSLVFGILGCGPALASAQDKSAVVQQAGDCSVNITGNNNTTASLVCNSVDPRLAEQIRAIVNGTRRNESAVREVSEKLDQIIKQMDQEAIPKLEVNPQGMLDETKPFSAPFRITNQGLLSVRILSVACFVHNVKKGDNVSVRHVLDVLDTKQSVLEPGEPRTVICDFPFVAGLTPPFEADIAIVVDYGALGIPHKMPRKYAHFIGAYGNHWEWLGQPTPDGLKKEIDGFMPN